MILVLLLLHLALTDSQIDEAAKKGVQAQLMNAYVGCLIEDAIKTDDHISDADTIARAIMFDCEDNFRGVLAVYAEERRAPGCCAAGRAGGASALSSKFKLRRYRPPF